MPRSYEDIDEALAELDDESDDEGLFSRRSRRRRRGFGGPQVIGPGNVSERRFATTIEKVGNEVATLESHTATAVKRMQENFQNFAMMSFLPQLLAQTTTVEDTGGKTVKVAVQSDNQLTLLLPLILMTQMTSGTASTQQGMGNNPMMMMLMVMAFIPPKTTP